MNALGIQENIFLIDIVSFIWKNSKTFSLKQTR